MSYDEPFGSLFEHFRIRLGRKQPEESTTVQDSKRQKRRHRSTLPPSTGEFSQFVGDLIDDTNSLDLSTDLYPELQDGSPGQEDQADRNIDENDQVRDRAQGEETMNISFIDDLIRDAVLLCGPVPEMESCK